eukprot:TRINITY_DN1073_c0_g1_i1.p1 TRINITY_DN1073_c0_g1~~TRINITY_DN1073_c0_g1_i1.p1  ORF type:complete len:371 (+),score=88.54 TRINITY_DN1073_c0_g1_i1:151-1263(+)
MGVPKTSRKGKKAWRQNISTADVDNYFVKQDKEARSGGPVDKISSGSLFYVDKTKDISLKRKTEKHKNKVLRCDSILQGNPFTKPLPSSERKKAKKKLSLKKASKEISSQESKPAEKIQKENASSVDIWKDKGGNQELPEEEKTNIPKRKIIRSVIPAVEVELPGCSYNPPFEAHQDALAVAVAEEMQKIYKRELEPKSVPTFVEGEPVDEETMCFLDVDVDADESLSADDGDATNQISRAVKVKRRTRAEMNRKARKEERLRLESELMKRKKVAKDIERLKNIIHEIDNEEQKREKKHIRRTVAKQERLLKAPPRLGKYKFEPEPTRVLLSEEITGSLRTVKACNTLARDRFKSLFKRGYLTPGKAKRR